MEKEEEISLDQDRLIVVLSLKLIDSATVPEPCICDLYMYRFVVRKVLHRYHNAITMLHTNKLN